MDTLISLGVSAAWLWSVYVLLFDGSEEVYLEVASGITVAILAGRYLEARAKRRAGAAVAALLELGAKEVSVLGEDGVEWRVPIEALQPGDRFVVRPGEKVARGRGGRERRRPVAPHRRIGARGEAARRRCRRRHA
jgi:Cu+-exporting ATPase